MSFNRTDLNGAEINPFDIYELRSKIASYIDPSALAMLSSTSSEMNIHFMTSNQSNTFWRDKTKKYFPFAQVDFELRQDWRDAFKNLYLQSSQETTNVLNYFYSRINMSTRLHSFAKDDQSSMKVDYLFNKIVNDEPLYIESLENADFYGYSPLDYAYMYDRQDVLDLFYEAITSNEVLNDYELYYLKTLTRQHFLISSFENIFGKMNALKKILELFPAAIKASNIRLLNYFKDQHKIIPLQAGAETYAYLETSLKTRNTICFELLLDIFHDHLNASEVKKLLIAAAKTNQDGMFQIIFNKIPVCLNDKAEQEDLLMKLAEQAYNLSNILSFLSKNGFKITKDSLIEACHQKNTSFIYHAAVMQPELFQADGFDQSKYNVLHYFPELATYRFDKKQRATLNLDALIRAENESKLTPLALAIKDGMNIDIIAGLIELGADVHVYIEGSSLIDYIINSYSYLYESQTEVIDLLCQYKVHITSDLLVQQMKDRFKYKDRELIDWYIDKGLSLSFKIDGQLLITKFLCKNRELNICEAKSWNEDIEKFSVLGLSIYHADSEVWSYFEKAKVHANLTEDQGYAVDKIAWYIVKRNFDPDHKNTFLFFGFGYSYKEKIDAADALLDAIINKHHIDENHPHYSVITQGELGKIFEDPRVQACLEMNKNNLQTSKLGLRNVFMNKI